MTHEHELYNKICYESNEAIDQSNQFNDDVPIKQLTRNEVLTSLYFVFMNKNFGFSAIPRKGINSFGLEKDKRKLLVKFYSG